MSERSHDEEREKKSWREIDASREKKSHKDKTSSSKPDHASRSHAYRDYKTQLEKLFNTGKVAELVQAKLGAEEASKPLSPVTEKRKALERLEGIKNRKEWAQALAEYEVLYGFPESETLLAQTMDQADEGVVLKALETLERMQQEGRLKKGASFRARIKTVCMTCDEPQVQKVAKRLLDVL
jgi:hypothetical protein